MAGDSQRETCGKARRSRLFGVAGVRHLVYPLEASGIFGWDVAEEVINMAIEQRRAELLGEVVGHVEGGIDTFKFDEVAFDPFAEVVVFNIHVSGTGGGFLSVCHGGTCVVVLIKERSCILWYAKVPKNAPTV